MREARSSPILLASRVETRYIVAEIEDGDAARDIVSEVRMHLGIDVSYDPSRTVTDAEIRAEAT